MLNQFLIDGVVLVDPDYIKNRKVFGHVLAAFRYGREDLDVLGLTFRKDLFLSNEQIFPVKEENSARSLTRLQERLIKKLGSNAYPFYFEVCFTLASFIVFLINTELLSFIASSTLSCFSYTTTSTRRHWKTMRC